MNIPGVFPEKIQIGNFEVSETLVTAYCVTGVIIVLLLLFRFVALPRFKEVPRGGQNLIELVVGGVTKFSTGILGEYGKVIAPYILTLFTFIIIGGLTEYMGVRSPATDLNCTIGLALISFVLIIAFAIRYKGVVGWLKTYAQPMVGMIPINILSAIAEPISLACRLFGNLFSGLLIMDMIYGAMGNFAIFVPALASIYLILFHIGMQSYVFTTLTMSYMKEKLE